MRGLPPPDPGHGRDGVFPIPSEPSAAVGRPFHVMGKPVGPLCNLDCKYRFYLGKQSLFPAQERFAMSDAVLDVYIREFIGSTRSGSELRLAGGEPTLLGVDFFRKVVALQAKHANGKHIGNALQTNGTLLDNGWGEFLSEHRFLVGVSIDGPRDLHDAHRPDKRQQPTFDRVMAGVEVLKKHAVEFNTLTCVHRENVRATGSCRRPMVSPASTTCARATSDSSGMSTKMMSRLLSARLPPAFIMGMLEERDRRMGYAGRAVAGSA